MISDAEPDKDEQPIEYAEADFGKIDVGQPGPPPPSGPGGDVAGTDTEPLTEADWAVVDAMEPTGLQLSGRQMLLLFGQLHLALRHPSNHPDHWPRSATRSLIMALAARIMVTANLRKLCVREFEQTNAETGGPRP